MSQQYKVIVPSFILCFEQLLVCVNKLTVCLYYHYLDVSFFVRLMALMVQLSTTLLDASVLL